MSATKTARWLDLIAFLLRHRYPVTREQIFERVGGYLRRETAGRAPAADEAAHDAARRAFERDKRELRDLGILIQTVALPGVAYDEPPHGYRLAEDAFYLPYLELRPASAPAAGPERTYRGLARLEISPAELALLDRATARLAALDGSSLAPPARWLRRKLAFDLPIPLESVERILSHPLDDDAALALRVLQDATAARTPVRCRYYSIGRDAEERREIEPYGLFFNWGRWYVVARDRGKDGLRVFRVDRMSDAEPADEPAHRSPLTAHSFDVPPDFSIRTYLARAPWDLSDAEPVTVRVRFAFPESRWVQAQELGAVEEEMLDDGGAVLRFGVRDRNPFLRWLLTFPRAATVLSPVAIRDELATLRREVAALYASGDEQGEEKEST